MRDHRGFTLIELTIVISIIGILSAIAVPNFSSYRGKAYVSEALVLAGPIREDVLAYYDYRGVFPVDNAEAGLPAPETIKGKYVGSITVSNGTITIKFDGSDTPHLDGRELILTPQISKDNPTGPVIWDREDKS